MFTMALGKSTLLFHGSYRYQAEKPRWTMFNCPLLQVFGDTPWKMNGWKLNITLVWKVKSFEPKRHEVGFQPWICWGVKQPYTSRRTRRIPRAPVAFKDRRLSLIPAALTSLGRVQVQEMGLCKVWEFTLEPFAERGSRISVLHFDQVRTHARE